MEKGLSGRPEEDTNSGLYDTSPRLKEGSGGCPLGRGGFQGAARMPEVHCGDPHRDRRRDAALSRNHRSRASSTLS